MMKYLLLLFTGCVLLTGFTYDPGYQQIAKNSFLAKDTIPVVLPAGFMDDYGSTYRISDTLWEQGSSKYHILRWNKEQQYMIARNGANNKSGAGLYTRIDYMSFTGMPPYTWGYCYTAYDAKTDSLAEFGPIKADRVNPRKGCNGYPFSRMKPAQ